jgi:hypothetical protein
VPDRRLLALDGTLRELCEGRPGEDVDRHVADFCPRRKERAADDLRARVRALACRVSDRRQLSLEKPDDPLERDLGSRMVESAATAWAAPLTNTRPGREPSVEPATESAS